MKKLLCLALSVLMIALTVAPMTAAAVEDDGIYAAATTVGGAEILLPDAPDAEEMAALDSYELIIEDEPVLTVEQTSTPDLASGAEDDGYFSADFTIPESTYAVYLVGLSADKIEEIQSRIIASYVEGEDFTLIDLSFIDAEKTQSDENDDELCWAASSSNILTYTGWAKKAGFESADDLFEAYIDAFTDDGNNPYYGVGWFFNGVNTFAELDPTAASAAEGTGGFLKSYAFDMLSRTDSFQPKPIETMAKLQQQLREGCGIALGLQIYHNGVYSGGHSDTCWGYLADTAYTPSETAYYAGLFITDSDSDKKLEGDRRDAPNVLLMATLSTRTSNGSLYFGMNLDNQNYAVLNEYTWLLPYSDDLPFEQDPAANLNKTTTPDISLTQAYIGTDTETEVWDDIAVTMDKIESYTDFYYTPVIFNESDVTYSGKTEIKITCTNQSGKQVISRTLSPTLLLDPSFFTSYSNNLIKSKGLPEGDYTFTMTVNGNHHVTESYYYNNTVTFPLKVRDSFLLGDTDGDGVVNIIDATKIQRILAFYDEGEDARMLQRACIVGGWLSIVDATIIQRHLTHYEVSRPVGEKELYE